MPAVLAVDGEPVQDTVAASIDPVLLEILDTEVGGHLVTVERWIANARSAPARSDDKLLRAIHTMNGAFAMTEVPSITDAMTPAEAYVKRLLVAHEVASPEGVEAIAELAAAARATVAALHSPSPRVPRYVKLAARLAALRDSLPEASFSDSHLPTGDVPLAVGTHHDPLADEIAALDLSAYGDLTTEVTDATIEDIVATDALAEQTIEPIPEAIEMAGPDVFAPVDIDAEVVGAAEDAVAPLDVTGTGAVSRWSSTETCGRSAVTMASFSPRPSSR
jgi:chemosensory pili system protein ChpA (sensor histidine kinase/response regulator)